MKYGAKLQIKFMNFWKKHKNKILVGIIIWLIIILINNILKNRLAKIPAPSTTYTPHVSVLDENEEVPEKYQEPIENLVDSYFNYCNNGQYEQAYNLITEDCKKNNYPTLESFKGYVNHVFEGKKKIYNIQSYSIINNKYIYNMRILDDIMANGTTDGYYYYEEKIVLTEENGQMKLSIAEFIDEVEPNITIEDDYMIVKIKKKIIDYETETFTIQIKNKTDNYIVIADSTQINEIKMNYGSETRQPINESLSIIIPPNSFTTKEITFTNFYDGGSVAQSLIFGAVRILKEYDYSVGTTEETLQNALKLYSLEMTLL